MFFSFFVSVSVTLINEAVGSDKHLNVLTIAHLQAITEAETHAIAVNKDKGKLNYTLYFF